MQPFSVDPNLESDPMIPSLRRAYNDAFTAEKYRAYRQRLESQAGCPIEFRLCETPVFLPPALVADMVRAATEIWAQLSTPADLHRSLGAVPAALDVPGAGDHPLF